MMDDDVLYRQKHNDNKHAMSKQSHSQQIIEKKIDALH